MGHDHHDHNESYFQEQLSTIAICGAFAAAAIVLFFWQRRILDTMGFGGPSPFPSFIVWSGFALLVLVVLRAITLWRAVGRPLPVAVGASVHDNEHTEHEHGHDCGHDHDHGHHEHDPCHTHGALACSSGHEHGAAPWRYIVLLVPIILFLLGLPNKPPPARAHNVVSGQSDVPLATVLAGLGPPLPFHPLVTAALLSEGQVFDMDFKSLEGAAQVESYRKEWQGKMVRVLGQLALHPRSDRNFSLVRYRVQCCAADAVQYEIPALCNESLAGMANNQWVQVTGRVQFQPNPRGGGYMTVLIVPRRGNVVETTPDPNPYIQ